MARLGILVMVLGLSAGTARAEKRLDGGQAHSGFVLELNLGTRLLSLAGGGGGQDAVALGSLEGGIFLGYKAARVIFGVGLALQRSASGSDNGGTIIGAMSTSSADTAIKVVPGLRVALARSADKKVEMFGELDLGLGTTVHTSTPSMSGGVDTTVFLLSYQIGPGVRYWVHPQFAFSAFAGPQGDFKFVQSTAGTTTIHTSTAVTSIFAQLALMGVF